MKRWQKRKQIRKAKRLRERMKYNKNKKKYV